MRQVIAPRAAVGHNHVEPPVCALQVVLGVPVEHDEAVKGELALEDAVHELAVLAAVRVVDAVVGAHDGGDAGADAVHEGPEVVLVQRLVVEVGRGGLDAEIGAAVRLLLVGDEVLGTGSDDA